MLYDVTLKSLKEHPMCQKILEDVHVRDLPFSRPKRGVGIAVSVRRTLRASYSNVCSNYPVILVALRVRLRGSENT